MSEPLPQSELIDIVQLETTFRSAIIQEIFIMCIDDPQLNGTCRSSQRLAAVVVPQAQEMLVLDELETIVKVKQLRSFEILWAVIIERDNKVVRQTLENRYRREMINMLRIHQDNDHENVASTSDAIQYYQTSQSCLLRQTDEILDPTIQLRVENSAETHSRDIFLTGSTGFLGAYLLDELLKQTDANIHCLIRSSTSARTLKPRVLYIVGDLTLPQLGLNNQEYSALASKVHSIYHCGALVNFIKPYSELRAANVLGTREIIKLACLANAGINYISTTEVLNDSSQSGYVESKRVAEHLLKQARERGLSVRILRPGKTSA